MFMLILGQMLCGKLSSCLCLLPWDGQVVITHKTISVRNFIATSGQQTTQVSQQSAKTSHVLTNPISLIQSQLIFEVCDAKRQLEFSYKQNKTKNQNSSSGSSSPTKLLLAPKVARRLLPRKQGQTQTHVRVFLMDLNLSLGFTCPVELLSMLKGAQNNLQTKKTQA